MDLSTKTIHAGEPRPRPGHSVIMPIFQSAQYEDGLVGDGDVHYIRYGNTPNQRALSDKIAALEGTEDAQVAASGMAAIAASLVAFLKPGDHLIAQDGLYGGTYHFITETLREFGVEVDFVDPNRPADWEIALRPSTRVIYVESISNPLMNVPDLEQVAAFADGNGLVSMIDNTFPTPVNFRPIEVGFQVVLHSATKALNGHSDIVAGAVAGSVGHVAAVRKKIKAFGGSLDPQSCFLLNRGLKTLTVRIRYQNDLAQRLAEFLDDHPLVRSVKYPGLAQHPQHGVASRLFEGYSGLLSIELDRDHVQAAAFIDALRLPFKAPSLGGTETLVTRPAETSHADLSPPERQRIGISDELIRISVGLESANDLIEDFGRALESAAQ